MSKNDFEFSLGEWDADVVRYAPDGSVAVETNGRWSARSSFGGKVIEDNFVQQNEGIDDVAAFTLRTYCEATQRWEMVYLWAGQPATGFMAFVGNRVGDEMHLNLQQTGPGGLLAIAQIRFFDITEDSFSWENQTSLDNGATWHRATLLKLRRKGD